jgi:ABC-type bacteriocin/lantibiotic exporter with double-glycine peptidase domain
MYIQVAKVQQGLVTNMTAVLTKISMGVSGIVMAFTVGYNMAIVMTLFLPIMMISGCIRGHFTK